LYSDLGIPTNATGRLPRSKRIRAGLDAEYVDSEGDHGGRRKRSRPGGRRADDDVVVPRRRRARVRTRIRAGVPVSGPGVTAEGSTADGQPDQPAQPDVAAAAPPTGPGAAPNGTSRAEGARRRRRPPGAARARRGPARR